MTAQYSREALQGPARFVTEAIKELGASNHMGHRGAHPSEIEHIYANTHPEPIRPVIEAMVRDGELAAFKVTRSKRVDDYWRITKVEVITELPEPALEHLSHHGLAVSVRVYLPSVIPRAYRKAWESHVREKEVAAAANAAMAGAT